MIDKNMIEKYAEDYAYHNCSEEASYAAYKAFIAGINWFLGNLWHPMSETPEIGCQILIHRDVSKLPTHADINETFVHEVGYNYDWVKYFSKDKNYLRWLYVDDLLKRDSNG